MSNSPNVEAFGDFIRIELQDVTMEFVETSMGTFGHWSCTIEAVARSRNDIGIAPSAIRNIIELLHGGIVSRMHSTWVKLTHLLNNFTESMDIVLGCSGIARAHA